jgi:5-hydroxyisourate hydrolase
MTISTHVLDTSIGRPAASVIVRLARQDGSDWLEVSRGITNADGRVPALIPAANAGGAGIYRLTFEIGAYFGHRSVETFFNDIAIEFVVRDAAGHYHVPLLVSPFGYSTYRGT